MLFSTAAFIGILVAGFAAQETEELTGTLDVVVPIGRTGGPVPLHVTLNWEGRGILNGALEITCEDDGMTLCRYRLPNLALVSGPQTFRLTLPAMSTLSSQFPAEAKVRFVTDADPSKKIDLGTFTILLPGSDFRSLTIALVHAPGIRIHPMNHNLASLLRLDRFDPDPKLRLIQSTPVHLAADEFPTQALSYCTFDLVVLTHEGFAELTRAQLTAIARWVEAGGSSCVVPGPRAIFRKHHVDFLNRLARLSNLYKIDAAGRILPPRGVPPSELRLSSPELGRAVIALDPSATEASPAWRDAALFLWKVRRQQATVIRERGSWRTDLQATIPYDQRNWRTWNIDQDSIDYGPNLYLDDTTVKALIPQDVELLPTGFILLLLFLFVLLIGPVDYTVLGRFRARRFTWVLFPSASVGLTLLLIVLSNIYLGSGDDRRSVTVVDLDEEGNALRWTRFEMLFSGHSGEVERDLERTLFVPVGNEQFGGWGAYSYLTDRVDPNETVLYDGSYPGNYHVTQEIVQWTPQFNRLLSFEPRAGEEPFNWSGLREAIEKGGSRYPALMERVLQDHSFEGELFLVHGDELTTISSRGVVLPRRFLRNLCVRPQRGLFSVVSQVSPSGGGNFEDLSLLDPTNPDEWMVGVAYRDGKDYVVLRRLVRGGS